MIAEIITIGDEILIGQIVDTNSVFISKALNEIGISVHQITSIQDEKQHILEALEAARKKADLVLITGGLGPTKDDITKHTLCEYFEDTLVKNQEVLTHIEELFEKYVTSSTISTMNRDQALVPSKAQILHNKYGTAPGMWLEKDSTVFVSMPGVPYEMRGLMTHQIIPKLQKEFERPFIYHKTILTYGMGESSIAMKIEHWENKLPNFIKLAYLPNVGRVRLRLTGKGQDREHIINAVDDYAEKLYPIIGDIIKGIEGTSNIITEIGDLLIDKGLKLAAAESCTGGRIASQITEESGVSAFFNGSAVTYAVQSKIDILGVPKVLIDRHSVVSAEVVEAMAEGAAKIYHADYAIATTGNAGPTKGNSDVEVGTVFIGIKTPNGTISQRFNFGQPREKVVNKAVNKAFQMLLEEILKNSN
ncbi:nicotinamide-nucleotide amidohydrolase PncC [Kordia sp. SMS9]|uniref:CinA family nicotinamide mononucleotide deamidase-related protein n=1 Tax=Kordia sp. SMS9 TaxID=2282170 RepID=UPI000E0DF5A5|nr:CinA family nicotinamide mononucleotide deamidase-related protein [Kordia sp. SMS9]AXG70204.1 nicotinamide-nucleotide amidohydrolase PncC [Kordia sp. SMS9]